MGELQAKGVGRPRRREGCTGLQGASRAGENGVQTTGVMSTPPLSWDPGQVLRDLCAGLSGSSSCCGKIVSDQRPA